MTYYKTKSFPLSFYKMREDGRGRGVHCEVEESHTKVIINYCIDFLEQAEKDMNVLFASLFDYRPKTTSNLYLAIIDTEGCGSTKSTSIAALSTIRAAPQLGQKPRRLQLNATNCS